jgi:hypothetical protein
MLSNNHWIGHEQLGEFLSSGQGLCCHLVVLGAWTVIREVRITRGDSGMVQVGSGFFWFCAH